MAGPTTRKSASEAAPDSLLRLSRVNQAVGVLIGGGLTEDEALAELDARAPAIGIDRHLAAAKRLACLPEQRRSRPGFLTAPGATLEMLGSSTSSELGRLSAVGLVSISSKLSTRPIAMLGAVT